MGRLFSLYYLYRFNWSIGMWNEQIHFHVDARIARPDCLCYIHSRSTNSYPVAYPSTDRNQRRITLSVAY